HHLGELNIQCSSCHTLHWKAEKLSNSSRANPRFGMCCYQGKISLPSLHPPPQELHQLFIGQDNPEKSFCLHIRNYNSTLAMTSVGRKLDDTLNRQGGGPYVFKLNGELIH
ncbi:hypothetical protein BC827DRAFT_1138159, partial [Russula dissimulans]